MQVRVLLMGNLRIVAFFCGFQRHFGNIDQSDYGDDGESPSIGGGGFLGGFSRPLLWQRNAGTSRDAKFARDEISKSDRMQKELIANVSHDFKTPLTMIKAYASMIQEISGNNPEKRAKHTQVIIEEADRLTSLVNDLLDLSKIRSGIAALKPEVFDLSEYTFDVLEKFAYLSETQGYHFESDIEKDLIYGSRSFEDRRGSV